MNMSVIRDALVLAIIIIEAVKNAHSNDIYLFFPLKQKIEIKDVKKQIAKMLLYIIAELV